MNARIRPLLLAAVCSFALCSFAGCRKGGGTTGLGEEFVEAMLRSEPLMRLHDTGDGTARIDETFPVFRFAVDVIDRQSLPVFWSGEADSPSKTHFTDWLKPSHVVITPMNRGRNSPWDPMMDLFEDMWFGLLLHLCILETHDERLKLLELATSGTIGRTEFIHSMAKLDHAAVVRALEFVESEWLPWAARKSSFSVPSKRLGAEPRTDFGFWILRNLDRIRQLEELHDALIQLDDHITVSGGRESLDPSWIRQGGEAVEEGDALDDEPWRNEFTGALRRRSAMESVLHALEATELARIETTFWKLALP